MEECANERMTTLKAADERNVNDRLKTRVVRDRSGRLAHEYWEAAACEDAGTTENHIPRETNTLATYNDGGGELVLGLAVVLGHALDDVDGVPAALIKTSDVLDVCDEQNAHTRYSRKRNAEVAVDTKKA